MGWRPGAPLKPAARPLAAGAQTAGVAACSPLQLQHCCIFLPARAPRRSFRARPPALLPQSAAWRAAAPLCGRLGVAPPREWVAAKWVLAGCSHLRPL